ncbi:DUF3754 domain-containing protein [Acuticoccus sp.]|uniref:DUF3754 domain-containing protein n=1 Tax=Acuticoccus sp. TaxID=1904378 RepID=UPI003B52917D
MDATTDRAPREPGPSADSPEDTPRRRPFSHWARQVAGIPLPPEADRARERPIAVSRFIPLTRQAVIADLCRDVEDGAATQTFAELALRLERHRNHDYRALGREMRRLYLPFSPDADTLKVYEPDPSEAAAMEARLAELTTHLLTRANYTALRNQEITEILSSQSSYSLRITVDLAEYNLLQVFVRDVYIKTHAVRRPETAYILKYEYKVRVYRRLFVLLKLKSDADRARDVAAAEGISEARALKRVKKRRKQLPQDTTAEHIYIKVFKDMPEHDLQILFPLRRVQFRPFDKIKFFATAGGGTLFGIFTTTGKVLAATNPFAAVGALIGFAGLLGRQVATFFNQRTRYMMELAQKLFFHNLANNRAALALLLDRAEEEDVKEDLITLYFLAGQTLEERELAAAKRRIDDIIVERYGVAVDFELDDALSRLVKDGAVVREGSVLKFPTIAEASARYQELARADDVRDTRELVSDSAVRCEREADLTEA